jgi:hypothetical protein
LLVRPIGIAIEVAFGIVALLAISLWYFSSRRSSHLIDDPASIAKIMAMIPINGNKLNFIRDDGSVSIGLLEKSIFQKRFWLSSPETSPPMIETKASRHAEAFPGHASNKSTVPFVPVRPLEHRLYFGVLFSGVLLAASSALIFLQRWSADHNGKIVCLKKATI